jgi:SAM-dependent methyltransferase
VTTEPPHEPRYALQFSEIERQRFRAMAGRARSEEAEHWAAAGVVRGARVADIGCGPGAVLVELARIAGEDGEVVGVEPNPEARAAAEDEIATAGIRSARVVDGTGAQTGLPEGSFDAVMVRHVLYHVGPAALAVVRHCAALLRPGGHLYVVDTDMEAARVDPAADHPDAVDLIARHIEFQRGRGCAVGIGPTLGSLLSQANLALVQRTATYNIASGERLAGGGPFGAGIPTMVAAGAATPGDEQRWREALRNLASAPQAAVFMTVFVAVGRRVG